MRTDGSSTGRFDVQWVCRMRVGLLSLWLLVSLLNIYAAAAAGQETGDTGLRTSSRSLEDFSSLASVRGARFQHRRLFQVRLVCEKAMPADCKLCCRSHHWPCALSSLCSCVAVADT